MLDAPRKLVEIRDLKMHFPIYAGFLRRRIGEVKAVDGVSFDILEGETLGLVGESGCGKSTCGRAILRLYDVTSGSVRIDGTEIADASFNGLRQIRPTMQMVFQDPQASLNPRMTVAGLIGEPLDEHTKLSRKDKLARIYELMDAVGLARSYANRYPHAFSGGQRQRIGIARALALNPRFIVCDEPIAALDVSIQAQVVNLLEELQDRLGLTYLFISHDLSMVRHIADRVAVMYLGKLAELAPREAIYARPLHPYTQALLSAVPEPDPTLDVSDDRVILEGDVPSPANPPLGCNFSTRCPQVMDICRRIDPAFVEVEARALRRLPSLSEINASVRGSNRGDRGPRAPNKENDMKIKTALMGAVATLALAPAAMADRGTDGHVNIIYWQAPSILNPYLSGGTKDVEAASLVLEPLAGFDQDGNLFPRLVTEVPTVDNGGVSKDLTSITWHLKPGLKWSDGSDFTADDVVFSAQYCMNPDGGCAQLSKYEGVDKVEAIDPMTVKVTFKEPKPYPYSAFVGNQSPIIQKAQFKDCLGAKAPTCTDANFGPIGTGPFVVKQFRTNDVIEMEANPNYRDPAKPAFATLTLKGGGDAAAAARSVLETGEFDYAWNLQLAPDVLAGMQAAGKGEVINAFGTLVERIEVNMTDPSPDLPEGERSTAAHPHPILSDIKVRQALSMAIDRDLLVQVGYGPRRPPHLQPGPGPGALRLGQYRLPDPGHRGRKEAA